MIALELLINRIAAEYAIPGWLGRGIAYGESGHCWGKPPTDSCWIATEPDGRQSVGPFQIHDVHGLSIESRQDFENNTRWAMENSVGPAYHRAIASGITGPAALLEYVWRYGQRCAEQAIQPAVARALAYLERSEAEMATIEEIANQLFDETPEKLRERWLRMRVVADDGLRVVFRFLSDPDNRLARQALRNYLDYLDSCDRT